MEEQFTLPLTITIRPYRREDMAALDWNGEYSDERERTEVALLEAEAGDQTMLVAEAGGYPIAQIWINWTRTPDGGFIRGLRVFPFLRNAGLGRRLMAIAEQSIRERGCAVAELIVMPDNPDARRLYERLGYVLVYEGPHTWRRTNPDGSVTERTSEKIWRMRKELQDSDASGS